MFFGIATVKVAATLPDALQQTGGPLDQRERLGRYEFLSEETPEQRKRPPSGATFDTGGLIALDGNDRQVIALLARAAERGMRITIPATALAQAIRNPARQVRLRRLIRQARPI